MVDAGGAVGVALTIYHKFLGNERKFRSEGDGMKGSYLGPSYSDDEIEALAARTGHRLKWPADLMVTA